MPPRATVSALYADVPQAPQGASTEGLITWANLTGQTDLAASLRSDLAGTPLNVLRPPVTYQQKVTSMWTAYHTDPMFKKLINRAVEFVANGSRWQVHNESIIETSWTQRIIRWFSAQEDRAEREAEVWNAWADRINVSVPNTPHGLNEIVKWAARHCLISGMFTPHWKWGPFKWGKKVYMMPMQLTCYPASAITLQRPQSEFMQEQILLLLQNIGGPMSGITTEAPQTMTGLPANMIPLEQIGTQPEIRAGMAEAFCLKMDWSPGDLSTTRLGPMQQTGWGQYPMPPFITLLPQFALRQKMFAADLSIADAAATYQKVFKIGDKDNPIREPKRDKNGKIPSGQEGTIAGMRKIIEAGLSNPTLALYLPYWVDYTIKLPDIRQLMDETKYVASQVEMLMAFGIFSARSNASRNERFQEINTAAFEEMLETLRRLIWTFLQRLVFRIMEVNESLRTPAIWMPNPLNTKSKEFKESLRDLAKMGRMSSTSLLLYHGLDPDVEQRQIADDAARHTDDLYDDNVPISLVQRTTETGTPDMPDAGGGGDNPEPPKRTRRNRRIGTSPPAGRPPA